jgi:HAD superfamily hydrolase (TIGR01509 family)
MKPSKKHCIFDLDGTLLDSMTTWPPAMIKIMDDAGLEYPDDVVNIMTPIGFNGCADYFISLGHPEKDPERLTDIMYDYLVDDYSNRVMIKPYVREMLEKLRDDGIKIYALTASPHRTVDPCLAHNGIAHFFEEVMSTDDLMMKKSDPEIYKEVARRLGVRPDEIEFYDDNNVALRTAKSVGFRVIGVYDSVTEQYREEIESFADGYVECFCEMLK